MAINAGSKNDTFELDLSLFAGKVSDMAPGNLPAGPSPYCTDVFFGAQWVATRPALIHTLSGALVENADILSHLDYRQPTGQTNCMILYEDGSLWSNNVESGNSTKVYNAAPLIRFKAVAAFDKFFMAWRSLSLVSPFTDAQLAGGDTPTYVNTLGNVARVVTDGPGGGLSVTGVNIGPSDLVTPGTFAIGPAITSIVYGGEKTVTIVIPNRGTETITFYTSAEVTLASAQSLTVGQIVQLYNITWANPGGPQWANGIPVATVLDSTHFTIAISEVNTSNSATSGTFAYGNASTVSLNRVNNIVTAFLADTSASDPTEIQAGWFVTITDTQAASQAQLPNGTVPFTANELFQAIYPSSSGAGAVPSLLTGGVLTFYSHNHAFQGQFEYTFPSDGFNIPLTPPLATQTLAANQSVQINTYPASLLPGYTNDSGNSQDPMVILGVTPAGEWDGTSTAVAYDGAAGDTGINFCMVYSGKINIPAAGTYAFQINHQEGVIFGVGGAATNPGGNPNVNPDGGQTLTALNGYPIMGANNVSQDGGGWENPITVSVTFPTAGVYPFEIDWAKGDNDDTGGPYKMLVLSNVVSGSAVPIIPTIGPGTSLVQGDGVGNVNVTLPTAVESVAIGSWLYLTLNNPTPSYVSNWTISSNGTGLITVTSNPSQPAQVWTVGTEILLGGFTSTSGPQPTGWNGQTVTITAVNATNPSAPQYQFLWNGPTSSGSSSTGTATPVSAAYPQGWIQVTGVISTTEFTYQAVSNSSSQQDTGVVYDYFGSLNTQQALTANNQQTSPGIVTESTAASDSGIVQGFQVLSVDTSTTPNTITWYQQGFNDTYTGTHLLQVQPQSSIAGGPRGAFVFFINEDGGASPGSYPINLQLSGGTQFASVQLPLGPPGTSARGVAFTAASGSDYFALGAAQIPATAGQAPIITLGTIVQDNTTTSLIMDFTDVALLDGIPVSGANAVGSDYGDLTSTIVLAPCLGVIEYETYLIWWGELNNIKTLINPGMSGGYTPAGSPPGLAGAQPEGWDVTDEVNSITPSVNGSLVVSPDELGFAYQMTGSTGNLKFVIYSPTAGVLSTASIAISTLPSSWEWMTATFGTAMPAAIPQDALLYVCSDAGNNNLISQGAWQNAWGVPIFLPLQSYVVRFKAVADESGPVIWDLQFINALQPVLNNQLRLSYPENEFGYDDENGFTIALDTSDFIASCFKQRQFLYVNTENDLFVTQNNGQVPAEWDNSIFASECGSFGPDAVVTGKSTAWWLGRHGWQIFEGKEPKQINQPVIQDFQQINLDAAVNTCMGYDAVNRVVYASFPIGASVNPNFVESMSFRMADQAYNVPDPIHVSAISGKIISTDLGLKFTPMQLSINSMQMCNRQTPNGIAKVMTFGGGKAGPIAADVSTSAQGASGDVVISLTPSNANDFVIVCQSGFEQFSTPEGWTRITDGTYTIQVSNNDELTFDLPDPSPSQWAAVMASFVVTGEPSQEQGFAIDFGTGPPESQYTKTFGEDGVPALNAGDSIVIEFTSYSQTAPQLTVSDTQGNLFVIYQNSQNFSTGLFATSFMAIALGAKAGNDTVTINVSNFGTPTGSTLFAINGFVYSNLAYPVSYGQLYIQDFWNYPPTNPSATVWNCSDADYGQIFSEYQTYFFFSHDVEQQPNLSLYRKLFCYMAFHAVGVGDLTITPYVDSMTTPWTALPTYTLQLNDPGIDYDIGLDITGNRCSFRFTSSPTVTDPTNTNAAFLLTHMIVSARRDNVFPTRGAF